MDTIAVQATVWARVPDIDQVPKISAHDADCLRELRDVLQKHGALERFGIALLHKHFEITDDEILLETTDATERTQLIRPVKARDLMGRKDLALMTTCLKLVEGDAVAVVNCGCLTDKDGHTRRHDPPLG